MVDRSSPAALERSNRRTALITTGVVFTMLGASFAAVPLYDMFCKATGFGGTPIRATEASRETGSKTYRVRFDASVANGLPWSFEPEQPFIDVVSGVVTTVHYTVRNTGASETTGVASFNVLPEITGGYFNKLACFCYTDQTLAPGESREESVVFFVDPAIERDVSMAQIDTLTLSYTMYPAKQSARPVAANAVQNSIR